MSDKKQTLEETAEKFYPVKIMYFPTEAVDLNEEPRNIFIEGAKWQEQKMYSEEEFAKTVSDAYAMGRKGLLIGVFNKWFNQFKKNEQK